jgi:predicted Zn-dependent protease
MMVGAPPGSLPEAPRQAQQQPQQPAPANPNQREHQRILAAYNGAYEDARLENLLNLTVEKLVAASERPDIHYRVTILNSAAVNAFALPTGQLYITRGLIALANDTSELASVLRTMSTCSRAMPHPRGPGAPDRAREPCGAGRAERSRDGRWRWPNQDRVANSRPQEFEADGTALASPARRLRCVRRGVRFPSLMGRNADLKSRRDKSHTTRARPISSSHPATLERIKNAETVSASPPGRASATSRAISRASTATVWRGPEQASRGRRFLHPSWLHVQAPDGFTLDNTAQAVLGVKEGGGQALRLDVVRVPAEQTLADYLTSGWIENIDPKTVEDVIINGLPAATATAKGDQWVFRLYAVRFGSDVYRFIYASKRTTADIDRAFRESVSTFRRMTLAESQAAKPMPHQGGDRRSRRDGRAPGEPHGGRRPADRALPRAQRPRPERPRDAGRSREARGGVSERIDEAPSHSLLSICTSGPVFPDLPLAIRFFRGTRPADSDQPS